MEDFPVASLAGHVLLESAAAGGDVGEAPPGRLALLGRMQGVRFQAGHFRGGVAEHAAGGGVDPHHGPGGGVGDDQAVGGFVVNGFQFGVGLAQPGQGVAVGGDVPGQGDQAPGRAVGVKKRRFGHVEMAHGPGWGGHGKAVDRYRTADPGPGVGLGPGHENIGIKAGDGGQFLVRAPLPIQPGEAVGLDLGLVGHDPAAGGVLEADRVGHGVEQGAQALLALGQFPGGPSAFGAFQGQAQYVGERAGKGDFVVGPAARLVQMFQAQHSGGAAGEPKRRVQQGGDVAALEIPLVKSPGQRRGCGIVGHDDSFVVQGGEIVGIGGAVEREAFVGLGRAMADQADEAVPGRGKTPDAGPVDPQDGHGPAEQGGGKGREFAASQGRRAA